MFSDRTNWKLTHNRLTEAVDEARRNGAQVLDLTISNPTRAGLRYDEGNILKSLASPLVMDYDPQPKGLPATRAAVADYYRLDHGIHLDPEQVFLTTSTSEGYSFVFRLLCNAGDEILVPKPSYPLFEFLADLQDVKLVPYPLIYDHGWQMDFPSIEKGITERTRAVVVVHPNNPTGSYVQAGEQETLRRICREHALAIIADEVFLDYSLTNLRHSSFASNSFVLCFTLSGISKISALPQMKLAWITIGGPDKEVEAASERLEVIADTYLSPNAPVQWAAPTLLGQRQSIQRQVLDRVHNNLAELDHQLASQKMCQRLSVEGGWYAVLRVPVTRSDEELALALLKKKLVLVHPGHFYDFPSDGYLVLSLIAPEGEFSHGVNGILEIANSIARKA
jgi:alanine-synthesizing transaminase